MGIAPVGHRVTASTPTILEVDFYAKAALIPTIQPGQAESRFREIADRYFVELRQAVINEWERSYFANDGISNAWVDIRDKLEGQIGDRVNYFPAIAAKQTHNFTTTVSRVILGGRLAETRLISNLDFAGITINGQRRNLDISQSQEMVYIPVLCNFDIEFVDYIPDAPTEPPPGEMIQKTYLTGFDKPVTELAVP